MESERFIASRDEAGSILASPSPSPPPVKSTCGREFFRVSGRIDSERRARRRCIAAAPHRRTRGIPNGISGGN